eukprot:6983788-Lingulodinium_polyedra.AAC.1
MCSSSAQFQAKRSRHRPRSLHAGPIGGTASRAPGAGGSGSAAGSASSAAGCSGPRAVISSRCIRASALQNSG